MVSWKCSLPLLTRHSITIFPASSQEPRPQKAQDLQQWCCNAVCDQNKNLQCQYIETAGGKFQIYGSIYHQGINHLLKCPNSNAPSSLQLLGNHRVPQWCCELKADILGVNRIVGWLRFFHVSEVPLHGQLTVTMIHCHKRVIIQPVVPSGVSTSIQAN